MPSDISGVVAAVSHDRLIEQTLVTAMRRFCRRAIREGLAIAPESLRRHVARVPFSRYHWSLALVRGPEQVTWKSVQLEVDAGEIEGFFQYFLGVSATCSDAEVDALLALCTHPRTVLFDVGANVGALSLAVAAACPQVSIVSFEPDVIAAARFRQNLTLNLDLSRRVEVVQAAVGARDGACAFYPGPATERELGSLIEKAGVAPHSIQCHRLDSFCGTTGRFPDVLKVDVEGAELQVLDGMAGVPDDRWPRAILMEVHGAASPVGTSALSAAVHGALAARGYELFELTERGQAPARPPQQWPARIHIVARRSPSQLSRRTA